MQSAVLILTLAFGFMLANGAAKAFDCSSATLPSSIVICSDPELIRLADERQEAISEARARIGEEAWPALWENQRSYALARGIPQDRPPPLPVPTSIRGWLHRMHA